MRNLSKFTLALKAGTDQKYYGWTINEINDAGEVVGDDYIETAWSVHFNATSCEYQMAWSDHRNVANQIGPGSVESAFGEHIRLTLKTVCNPEFPSPIPQLFMFGYDQPVKIFELFVHPIDVDLNYLFLGTAAETEASLGKEFCVAQAFGDYLTEGYDFSERKHEKQLTFHMIVTKEHFGHYRRMIEMNAVNEILFNVASVNGFYTDISPVTSAPKIKILCSDHNLGDHMVHYLGAIGSTNLQFRCSRNLE